MSLLPLPIRTRLIAASKVPDDGAFSRIKAIDDVYKWARLHYPECFIETQGNARVPYVPMIIDLPNFIDLKDNRK